MLPIVTFPFGVSWGIKLPAPSHGEAGTRFHISETRTAFQFDVAHLHSLLLTPNSSPLMHHPPFGHPLQGRGQGGVQQKSCDLIDRSVVVGGDEGSRTPVQKA